MATSNGNYTNPSSASSSSSSSSTNLNTNPETDSEAATMRMLMANLPSTAFNTASTPDPRLQRARLESERTNQITPVLKEELRLRILHKRMEKGEPEIETGGASEPKNYELTDEEKAKRERRKAQNREAAKRCREKRKRKQLNEAEASELIREKNQQLATEVRVLQQRYDYLTRFLQEHVSGGQCHLVDRQEVQNHTGSTADSQGEQLLQYHQMAQQYQPLRESSDAECVPYKRQKTLSATKTDGVTVIERVDNQPEEADTVTISLPHNPLNIEETPRIAPSLCPLSSEDVSAILSEDIDLNLSDPSSDTSSPVNPTSLFPSFSDNSANTSFISFPNISGVNSPISSSFAISDGTSGLGTSLSFSDNDFPAHQASYAFNNTPSSSTSTNDISTFRQSELSPTDHQFPSLFNSNGHNSNEPLPNFSNVSSPIPKISNPFEKSGISPPPSGSQQTVLQTTTELQIKMEDNESLMSWSIPIPQPTIDTLIAFLNSDANVIRPDHLTHIDITKGSPLGHSFSPVTPNCSPATLSPASVCPDIPHMENLVIDRVSPSCISPSSFQQITQRWMPQWSPHPPATATATSVCVNSSTCSSSDLGTKVMPIPMTPGASTSNAVSFKFRSGIRRASTTVSHPGGPIHVTPVSTPHGFTTQLSSSSSSASSSTLSPPPSVPSPSPSSSHEVPESPSILVGTASYCDDGRGFGHHMSPMGAMISAHQNSVHLEDISSDED